MTHVVDGGRASWSALAALASLQRVNNEPNTLTIVVLGGETGRHRAMQAGITPADADVSLRKRVRRTDTAVAWDDSARTSIAKLAPTLPIHQPPTPIPPQIQLLDSRPRQEIRSQLDLPSDLPVVALLCDPSDTQGLFLFTSLLIAVSMAGFPATGITMGGTPDEKALATMSRIGQGAELVVRHLPPWALLPACDCAVALEPIKGANPFVADLVKWADAARAPVVTPGESQSEGDIQSLVRFMLAKKLLKTLKSQSDQHEPTRRAMCSDYAACDRWLEDFRSQLHDAADHSGAL